MYAILNIACQDYIYGRKEKEAGLLWKAAREGAHPQDPAGERAREALPEGLASRAELVARNFELEGEVPEPQIMNRTRGLGGEGVVRYV